MGCKSSKQSVCQSCNVECSPVRRSHSWLLSHPSPRDDNNSHRVVTLISTTLGHLLLDPSTERKDRAVARVLHEPLHLNVPENDIKDFALGMVEAKTWSKLIDEKNCRTVPKTPVRTPPGEPEAINAWELMEGLDDSSPIHLPSTANHIGCLSIPLDQSTLPLINEKQQGKKEKLILYFTSLRGVRKTYEDCCNVRVILKNYGVRVDERDVSMHSGFKDELKELLGDRYGGGTLPKVFLGRKYIGGSDEIRQFHDESQLDKVLEGCEMVADGGSGGCEACGDIRFLPCETCSGSCKIYHEVNLDENEEVEEEQSDNYGFQRCPDCNENGLVRCRICSV